jgi:predicted membrane channel-forming protein YqfA (hemolysin III family)
VVTVPAFVWRGGFLRRALIIGGAVGLSLGALAWIDSGFLLAGILVLVIVGVFYGIWMPRRMARYWPGSKELTGDERVAVVQAARRGEPIDDARLAQPVINYSSGLHAAAEAARLWRWLLVFVLVVAALTALWDTVFGSWGNAVASGIYLVALLIELFWWPKRRDQLLSNADRAADMARAEI